VRHILLQCPLYTGLRAEMLNKLAKIKELNGRTSDYDGLISSPQAIRFVAECMHRTGLSGQFREVELTEPAMPAEPGQGNTIQLG
jgi:hypothetical protein